MDLDIEFNIQRPKYMENQEVIKEEIIKQVANSEGVREIIIREGQALPVRDASAERSTLRHDGQRTANR